MPSEITVPASLTERLHREAGADTWRVSLARFAQALDASVGKAFSARTPASSEIERYLSSLHLSDLALACACADGDGEAWDHFVREHRPTLYRAAEAIVDRGEARELADSLYAELFGVSSAGARRRSLLLYFHGRSSLATWLRAVLAQRHVDRIRKARRHEPLDETDTRMVSVARHDPERARWLALMTEALGRALCRLTDRDRLRLTCYYAQDLTLAQVGVALREHEATVSRHIARIRRAIRQDVEGQLREEHGLNTAVMAQCFQSVIDDAGPLDLAELLGGGPEHKESALERSKYSEG